LREARKTKQKLPPDRVSPPGGPQAPCLRGLWVAGIAVAIVAAVIAVATVAAIACSGALGVIAAVLLAGIIRIICLCGVGGVHSAAAHIGVTGLLCLGLFRLSARWLPVIILRAARPASVW